MRFPKAIPISQSVALGEESIYGMLELIGGGMIIGKR